MIRTVLLTGGSDWIFVKLVTITFALIALSRLLPGPNRQVPNYRPRPLRTVLRCGGGLAAIGLAAGCAVAVGHRAHVPVVRPPVALTVRLGTEPMSYLGVFEPAEMQSYRPIASFGSAVRRRPNVVVYYSGWLDPFQVRFAQAAFAHGATPLVQMLPKGISMAAIAGGRYDGYLRSFADQVRSYRRPVIIGFAPEMNGTWYSYGWHHTPPETWVAAWRHVVTLFRAREARNVTWLWVVNRSNASMGPLRDYWPGAAYVNWIGIDGYYYGPGDTFPATFGPTIDTVRTLTHDPVLLSEVAIGPVAGQTAKLPDLFQGARAYHLLGLVWFDQAQNGGHYHQDWRLEDDPAALTLFRQEVRRYL